MLTYPCDIKTGDYIIHQPWARGSDTSSNRLEGLTPGKPYRVKQIVSGGHGHAIITVRNDDGRVRTYSGRHFSVPQNEIIPQNLTLLAMLNNTGKFLSGKVRDIRQSKNL